MVIYRNKRTNQYLVQPLCKHPDGYRVEQGERLLVDGDDFDARIAPAVVEGLKESRREYNEKETVIQDKTAAREFDSEHDQVSVQELQDGSFEIMPYRRERGGYEGKDRAAILLRKPEARDSLAESLRAAFRQCE